MSEKPEFTKGKDPSFKPLMRSLALEAVFYTPLVIGYFFLLERFAKEPLYRLYRGFYRTHEIFNDKKPIMTC